MGELEQTVARHDEQIKTLFKNQECLNGLAKSVARMVEKIENIERGQDKIEKAVETLKDRPARHWNIAVAAIITGVVGAAVGAAMGMLLK